MEAALKNQVRLIPGEPFPAIELAGDDGTAIAVNAPGWRAVFVIRGAHCSICRKYLGAIEAHREGFEASGVSVVVISADPIEKASAFAKEAGYFGRVAGGLRVEDMRKLGLWMTGPEVSQLDYVHAEPGFFLIDPEGNVATAEASSLPAGRPDLDWLHNGFSFMTENDIRPRFGRYEAAQ